MANYATLKAAIQDVIKQNGNNEITGVLLQQVLLSIINSLGEEYQFAGVATPSTNPGTPDHNVAYIGGAGTYPNFNGEVIPEGMLGLFKYDGSWGLDLLPVHDANFNELFVQEQTYTKSQIVALGANDYYIQLASLTWNTSATYKHFRIPLSWNRDQVIYATCGEYSPHAYFLKSNAAPSSGGTPDLIVQQGYPLGPNKTTRVEVPRGAEFLCIYGGKEANGYQALPLSLTIYTLGNGKVESNAIADDSLERKKMYPLPASSSDLIVTDESGNVLVDFSGGHIRTRNFDSRAVNSRSMRILGIGNSWTQDGFAYAPAIIESVYPEIDIQFDILYSSGATLETHANAISANSAIYNLFRWTTAGGKWISQNNVSANSMISNNEYDIIILQQQSSRARDYATFQPYLNNIIHYIWTNAQGRPRLGWFMTPPYPEGYSGLTYEGVTDTPSSMFEKIVAATRQVLDETPIEMVFTGGTAIIDGMTNPTLDAIGDYGHLFYEGAHLQEGLPMLLENYVNATVLMRAFNLTGTIWRNDVRPTQAWITAKEIPGQNGQSVGVTDANVELAQRVAIIALNNPYEITDCENI